MHPRVGLKSKSAIKIDEIIVCKKNKNDQLKWEALVSDSSLYVF